jgi:hypothetical protein
VELDYCISSSHHGPSSFWLAKVDDAITANATELDWFKISEDGLTAPGMFTSHQFALIAEIYQTAGQLTA